MGWGARSSDDVSHILVWGASRTLFPWSTVLGFTDGDFPGNLSLGQYTGDGKLDGETLLGRTWMFFSGSYMLYVCYMLCLLYV